MPDELYADISCISCSLLTRSRPDLLQLFRKNAAKKFCGLNYHFPEKLTCKMQIRNSNLTYNSDMFLFKCSTV